MRPDFAARYGPWALVAGASEGIGAAFARQIAAAGVNVVLVARRVELLEELAAEIRVTHGVEVRIAPVDLTGPDLLHELALAVIGAEVGLLVYNAGAVHGADLFVERTLDDALHLVNLNCRGVTVLTHHFARSMVERRRGGIILMTSMSAVAGSGYTAAYNATKAFDLVLAEGLWMELATASVDVLAVPAGLTETPAMRRSGILDADAGFVAMAAEDVAREALDGLGVVGPMLVPGAANQEAAAFMWPVARAQLVRAMTDGATALYHVPVLDDPATAAP
jgi:short-subunit dehydrogenase